MRPAAVLLTVLASTTVLAAGCGSSDSPPASAEPRISLKILPDTYVAGGKAVGISLNQRCVDGLQAVEIRASGAEDLHALLFALDYDATVLSPLRVEGNSTLSGDGRGLSLSLLQQPGHLEYGAMQMRPQDGTAGLSGDQLLATVWFEHRAFSTSHRVSTPPSSDSSRATLRYDDASGELRWEYYNQGDYNQDGRVAVSDLTPIGIHFGDSVPAGSDADGRDNLSIENVIDGSNDGVINVQDLSAIGQNFGNQVAKYVIRKGDPVAEYPASNTDVSVAAYFGEAAFPPAGNPSAGRLTYALLLSAPDEGRAYWVRPQDSSGAEGTPSQTSSVGVHIPGWHITTVDESSFAGYRSKLVVREGFDEINVPAIIYFRVADMGPRYGYASTLDVHGANMSFLTEFAPAGFAGDAFAAFSDSNGKLFFIRQDLATNELLLHSNSGSSISNWVYDGIVDTPPDQVKSLNGTMAAGQPAFAFYRNTTDPNDGLLIYDYFDGAAYHSVTVAGGFGTFDTGKYNSLAVINGVPAIAYYDAQSQNLWYIRANDLLGTSWPANGVQVEAGGIGIDTGLHVVLLEVAGRPAVFYQENGVFASRIMYKWADDSLGTAWPGSGVVVGNSDNPVADSIPFSADTDGTVTGVAYVQGSAVKLRMLSDPSGVFDPEEKAVNAVAASPSLAILDGQPAFTLYVDNLKYLLFMSKY